MFLCSFIQELCSKEKTLKQIVPLILNISVFIKVFNTSSISFRYFNTFIFQFFFSTGKKISDLSFILNPLSLKNTNLQKRKKFCWILYQINNILTKLPLCLYNSCTPPKENIIINHNFWVRKFYCFSFCLRKAEK